MMKYYLPSFQLPEDIGVSNVTGTIKVESGGESSDVEKM